MQRPLPGRVRDVKIYRFLIGTGVALAVLGFLVLTFQATLYVIFGEWYGFSILNILEHLSLHEYLVTNLPSFNDLVDVVLNIPLGFVLIVLGGLVGLLSFHALREENKWSPPET